MQSPPSLPLPKRAAVVVMRAPMAEFFGPVTSVLWDAGLTCFEYTLTTAGALDSLADARAALPDAVFGVGTVRSPHDLDAAHAAGAHFAVSQIFRPEFVQTAQERGLPFVPGALTPTEVANAWASGVPAVKVSPIGPLGGVKYLNELRGPLPDVALMPTGGVTLESARAYLDAGAVAVGVSTALLGDALIGGDLAELKNRAQRLVDVLAGNLTVRVVVAPDKFKGSLTATEVARHLAHGLRLTARRVDAVEFPVGDGGDGTLDAFRTRGYEPQTLTATGSLSEPRRAAIAMRDGRAVIELAEADGLRHLARGRLQPTLATSRGVGELILAALDAGCRQILLGLGGSANTDGGAGMIQALGARLRDGKDNELAPGGAALAGLARIDVAGMDPRLTDTTFLVATDVNNPLLGPRGAAAVFGPQKGATPEDVAVLERGLTRWTEVVEATTGTRHAATPGAGAAGGVGFASLTFLNSRIRPGIEVVLEALGFEEVLVGANAVVTGEGSLDDQTLSGKAPIGVAAAAARQGVPTVAVAGRTTLDPHQAEEAGLSAVLALTDLEPDPSVCIRDAARLLEGLAPELLRALDAQVARRTT